MKRTELESCDNYRATYCPEDDKLRLYVGRVPREEYLFLKAEGWTSTPKQDCDFVAHWSPERNATAIQYAGIVEDEDMGPEDRAADRAERFLGYQDRRADEATQRADTYDAGPSAHGYQNAARAEKAAARHDRVADKALDAWSKAEYWQRRTAGVISHALHKSSPEIRMGRIKEIESAIRKAEKSREEYNAARWRWLQCSEMMPGDEQDKRAAALAYVEHGEYVHPRTGKKTYLFDLIRPDDERNPDPLSGAEICALYLARHGELEAEGPWLTHYRLRLAYEQQMLEAQGGRAGAVEMIPGGWLISGKPGYRRYRSGDEERQIVKVNKSPVTGRVVSVEVRDNQPSLVNHWGNPFPDGVARRLLHTVKIERASPDCYRAPTEEELAEFNAAQKAAKAAKKAATPAAPPLLNPTNEDAERLQALINEHHLAEWTKRNGQPTTYHKPSPPAKVEHITQAVYSANSKGNYAKAETRDIHAGGLVGDRGSNLWTKAAEERRKRMGPVLCKIRMAGYDPVRVLVITDKPQKPLPAEVWTQQEQA